MDEYIERLQVEGSIDLRGGGEPESSICRRMWIIWAPTVGDAELKGELKKLNKHLRQMINLKK
jgi:hypothetical protein